MEARQPADGGRTVRRVLAASEPVAGVVARISTNFGAEDVADDHPSGSIRPVPEVEAEPGPGPEPEPGPEPGPAPEAPQDVAPAAATEATEPGPGPGPGPKPPSAREVPEDEAAAGPPADADEGPEGPGKATVADVGPLAREPFGDDYETLVRVAEQTLDAVDRALARLEGGRYGACEACGEPIGDDVLVADPTAATCERHLRPA